MCSQVQEDLVAAEAEGALQPQALTPFFWLRHEPHRQEPCPQRLAGPLEDRGSGHRGFSLRQCPAPQPATAISHGCRHLHSVGSKVAQPRYRRGRTSPRNHRPAPRGGWESTPPPDALRSSSTNQPSWGTLQTNTAFWPVADQLERAAGFLPRDSSETKLVKLQALLAEAVPHPGEAVPLLAALLKIPRSGHQSGGALDAQQRKARTFDALVAQLEGLARQLPVLLVLEDAHWIDATTAELIDVAIERLQRLPAMLVVTFRTDFQPPWTTHAQATLLTLNRLGARQSTAIVGQVSGGKALPTEVLERILASTDGVPLFVEEMTKAVLELGLLKEEGGRYVLTGALPMTAIPSTLHGSLLARLDRLAPVKEVAQIGAVIGREFAFCLLAAVASLPEDRLTSALEQVIAAELVFRRGLPPDAVYVFKHALVQEAAYTSC